MISLATLFTAKLLSPILLAACLAGTYYATKWWHIFITALAGAMTQEVILYLVQYTRGLYPGALLIGFVAALCWAALLYWIKSRLKRS
ncbi:MAG: hypothetical protein AAGC96_06950 [Pseudomonadota bacterium]